MGTIEVTGHEQAATARAAVRGALAGCPDHLVDAAELVAAELVTNALLHGGGWAEVSAASYDGGARIEVADRCRNPPLVGLGLEDAMTGRGLRLVTALAARWGVDARDGGKVVWAEVSEHGPQALPTEEDVLAAWPDWGGAPGTRYRVTLGEVPTDLLISAKAHVDNLVREFTLVASGAVSGLTARIPPHLAELVEGVVHDFAEARLAIKRQAVEAARAGRSHTMLKLELSPDAAAAGERYLEALDEADAYCRAMRLLTLETPPQHRIFRRWYVGELVAQLRAAAAGVSIGPPETFEQRLLRELDVVTHAGRAAARVARLYSVAGALAVAATPEAVADAVLKEAVAALGASGGGVLTRTAADRLALPGAVGYPEHVVEGLRHESRDAELPAALALRTGETVWLESRQEIEVRFPELAGVEPDTAAVCAVPLATPGRLLGALRFSFTRPRLFDEDERRFVLALAALTAQALDRAQLLQDRVDVSHRLQQSLLPPRLPDIPGLEVAAVYDPLGDGVDVGGDFYDAWKLSDDQWAVAIGDVTGNGPEAAAVTALARYTLRALTMVETSLETTLLNLNAAMLTNALPMGDGERFCTLVLARVTVGEGIRVELASGGHPYPVLRSTEGTIEEVRLEGSLLGAVPDPKIGCAELSLDPGDLLVLYTDGVSEARDDGGFFEVEGVLRVLGGCGGTARQAVETLESAVLAHTHGDLTDDMAIVALRLPDEGGARGAV